MSRFEDEDLTDFLRRHRSRPPAADPALEDRMIESLPRRRRGSRSFVMIMAGVAACFVGVLVAQPVRSPSTDAAEIEAFMESSWSGTVDGTAEAPIEDLALVELASN